MYLSVEDIEERVSAIKTEASMNYYGLAYRSEDNLRSDFIEHVQDNPTDPELSIKAKLVLSTSDIQFSRWCA